MVGQQAFLQVAAASPYLSLPTNITWAFTPTGANNVVANYGLSSLTSTTPTTLATPETVDAAGYTAAGSGPTSAPLYWVSKGMKSVSVTAAVGGQPASASVQYPIHAPTVTPTQSPGTTWIQTGPVTPSNSCSAGEECIFAGNPYAVLWTYSVTAPKIGGGQIAITQLIEDEQWSNYAAGGTASQCTANAARNPQYWLDGGFPYWPSTSFNGGQSVTWNPIQGPHDAPEYDVPYGTISQAARTFHAIDYWMYAPTYTSSRPSIWVTLEKSTWTFQNSWTEVTPTPSPTATPAFVQGTPLPASGITQTAPTASSQLPSWPQTLQGNYSPCNYSP
jgi:hypothetical protein